MDLKEEAKWIQYNLTSVLDRHATLKPIHPRSKRWWTDEIKQERKRQCASKRALRSKELPFEEYRQIRNGYYCCIRRAKREAGIRFLEGVLPTKEEAQTTAVSDRCWNALRYTKPRTPSYTPAIKIIGDDGQPEGLAASAEEKKTSS